MLARVYRVYRAAGDRGTAVARPDTNVAVGGEVARRLHGWRFGTAVVFNGVGLTGLAARLLRGRAPQNWLGEWDDF